MDDSGCARDRRPVSVDLHPPMIRTVCDVCDKAIGRVYGDWFGVDYARLDDDGELVEPSIDHEFHFCSTDHLVAWAMQRSYLPPEEATT